MTARITAIAKLRKNASRFSIDEAKESLGRAVERDGGRAYLYLKDVCVWGCEHGGFAADGYSKISVDMMLDSATAPAGSPKIVSIKRWIS